MKKKILLCLLCMVILFSFSGCQNRLNRYQAGFMDLFDTATMIIGYEPNREKFDQTVNKIHEGMQEYHELYDLYHEYEGKANLRTINLHPGEPVKVDQKIIDLLLFAKEISEASGGKTDVTLGSVLSLWHDAREAGIADPENAFLPDESELKAAAGHTGFENIEINTEEKTVYLKDPMLRLDVGAIAKGYAVQKICDTIPTGYLLSVGGNVYATGPKGDGKEWIVGVQDPNGGLNDYVRTVSLRAGAVVTSGDYQRTYTVDGTAYHHIIDPETLYPGKLWRSVTIRHPDSGVADALSTTLFLSDREQGEALLQKYGASAMWIDQSGNIFYSSGFEEAQD